MKTGKLLIVASTVLTLTASASSPAWATEGYFSHGYGAVDKSMAGASVSFSMDAMSQAINPASLTGVPSQLTIELSGFSPRRSHAVTGAPSGAMGTFPLNPGSFDSDKNFFAAPSIAGSHTINDSSAFGWAFYANGGMNTTWDDPAVGVFGDGTAGVDAAQGFLQFTYARKLTPAISVGISPMIAVQRFKAQGLAAFSMFSSSPSSVSGNGFDYSFGFGGKAGVQAKFGPGFSFGAAYQSQMFMSKFDKYAGLFAEGDFDIPATLQAGVGWNSDTGVTVGLDYKRIFYGSVKSIANSFLPNLQTAQLGDSAGAGFGWESMNVVKLGVQWQATSKIAVRAGAALNSNPISSPNVIINILAPGVQEQHYTAGLTWKLNPSNAINFAFMYSPEASVTGPNVLEAPDQQTISISMWQLESTVGWARTF